MKILVLSDSHGNVDNMARCVEMVQPRHILHLGDCIRDARQLQQQFPHIPMDMVPGNCDWGTEEPEERLLELRGVRILMMHGHTRHVKFGHLAVCYAAREMGAQILLFGHTHQPLVDFDGELWVMNPGSVRDQGTCGIITIEPEKVICSTYRL